jgi:gluconokinase
MAGNDLILAVDVGTSATKAVLFDAGANQIAIVRKHYPILAPRRSWSEQEPDAMCVAVLEAMREATRSLPARARVAGVAFSSQLYSVLAVDARGKALTNSLTWSDTRSADIAQSISQRPEAPGIYQRTGCPIDAIYPLAKIEWLKENRQLPENARFVSVKEYILFKLTGLWVADWSIASATGLFDIRKYAWDETALSLLHLTPADLSELVPPRFIITAWEQEITSHTGLLPGTPLIIGGGDGPLASLGVGAYKPDTLAVNVGTSAAARSVISEAQVDPQGRLWTYVVDKDLWVIGGIVSSGGIVYDWFLRNLVGGIAETEHNASVEKMREQAESLASAVPPGAEDLIFIPYLGGEQCPTWYPHTRGGFFGLDFRHQRGHLTRAVLEGITRSIFRIAESIQSLLKLHFSEIRVTGGLTASPLWLQVAADMFGSPITVPESVEGSARGAAMLASIALGLRSDIEEFADPAAIYEPVRPEPQAHAYYRQQYQRFQRLLECARSF